MLSRIDFIMSQKKSIIPGPGANIYLSDQDRRRYTEEQLQKIDYDLEHLYTEYSKTSKTSKMKDLNLKLKAYLDKGKSSDALFYIFIHSFYQADNIELENIIIQIILDYNLQKERFVRSLRKLVILFQERTEDRYKTLIRILRDLHELTSQTAVTFVGYIST